jgi:hypothetical protein
MSLKPKTNANYQNTVFHEMLTQIRLAFIHTEELSPSVSILSYYIKELKTGHKASRISS